ncbi:10599_t:CDS:2, partial [Funneliformis caledonium]
DANLLSGSMSDEYVIGCMKQAFFAPNTRGGALIGGYDIFDGPAWIIKSFKKQFTSALIIVVAELHTQLY